MSGTLPVDVFELGAEHEQVVFCNDPASGLRAIVAIHSTALGPALGGTRFYPYASTAAAIADVLALSRGMSYKAALAGLDLGGGKAVIIGDPAQHKSEALLRAYGRFVQSLNGRYRTAADVGTFSADMDLIARECDFVTGRTTANGGAGDSSVLTAYGVFQGLRAAATVVWDTDSLAGRTVGVSGVGKVGRHLVRHLVEADAKVVITDVVPAAVERIRAEHPTVTAVDSADALVAMPLDVYAPCALGFALTDEVVEVLSASIVCGAANNQLAHPGVEKALEGRGILYAPDYCVNSGGLIQVADELEGFGPSNAPSSARRASSTPPGRCSSGLPPTASRRRSRPTGWPRRGCATSDGCGGSGSIDGQNHPLTSESSRGQTRTRGEVSPAWARHSRTTRQARRLPDRSRPPHRAAPLPAPRSPSHECGTSGRGRPWSAWLSLGRGP